MMILLFFLTVTLSLQSQLPISGDKHPYITKFDNAVQVYLTDRDYKSATLALIKDGRLYKRGYGYQNPKLTRTIDPDTPMRIASISKVVTNALVKELVSDFTTPVFDILRSEDYMLEGVHAFVDERVQKITLQHLMSHTAGFNINAWGFDPAFLIKQQFPQPLRKSFSQHMILQYMLSNYLLHADPGAEYAYSNFGYLLLQHVIEKLTQSSYQQYVENFVQPLGITSLTLGFKKRHKDEIWYDAPPHKWRPDILGAAGGLICSAPDLCRFMQHYWITGDKRAYPGQKGGRLTFFGSLPTTTAMVCQFPDGTDVAVLINTRRDATLWDDLTALETLVSTVLEG